MHLHCCDGFDFHVSFIPSRSKLFNVECCRVLISRSDCALFLGQASWELWATAPRPNGVDQYFQHCGSFPFRLWAEQMCTDTLPLPAGHDGLALRFNADIASPASFPSISSYLLSDAALRWTEETVPSLGIRLSHIADEQKRILNEHQTDSISFRCETASVRIPMSLCRELGSTVRSFIDNWDTDDDHTFNLESFSSSDFRSYCLVVCGAGEITSCNCHSIIEIASLLGYSGLQFPKCGIWDFRWSAEESLSNIFTEAFAHLPESDNDLLEIASLIYRLTDPLDLCRDEGRTLLQDILCLHFSSASELLADKCLHSSCLDPGLLRLILSCAGQLCAAGKF